MKKFTVVAVLHFPAEDEKDALRTVFDAANAHIEGFDMYSIAAIKKIIDENTKQVLEDTEKEFVAVVDAVFPSIGIKKARIMKKGA